MMLTYCSKLPQAPTASLFCKDHFHYQQHCVGCHSSVDSTKSSVLWAFRNSSIAQVPSYVSWCFPSHMIIKYLASTWLDTINLGTITLLGRFDSQIPPTLMKLTMGPNHITLNCCAQYLNSSAQLHGSCHGTWIVTFYHRLTMTLASLTKVAMRWFFEANSTEMN